MGRIAPVILCGGSGTRLWPLSRESHPKQFVDLGGGRTLFKDTLERVRLFENRTDPIIVCNEEYKFYVLNQLAECGMKGFLILEPAARNTAPAIYLAAKYVCKTHGEDDLMLVMPSDHQIEHPQTFINTVEEACPLAEKGFIVTFGVAPYRPSTAYGYIRAVKQADNTFGVAEFVEKPNAERAAAMLACGDYYWNAGIFLSRPDVMLEEISTCSPAIAEAAEAAWNARTDDKTFLQPGKEQFLATPANSIDYAVMEHTSRAALMPLEAAWSDLGSWDSFFQNGQKDEANNVCAGDVWLDGVKDSYIQSCGRMVAAIGVSNLTIIETGDAVLVAARDAAQQTKEMVSRLKENDRCEYKHHPLVYRPWGSYETIAQGDRFKVKRIIVNPGESLSLQLHHHRAEHWVVVSGTAEITIGEKTNLFTENQSTYIPLGIPHRVHNPGIIPLMLIEIQSGAYLGEDDIRRIEDRYGRV